MRLLIDIEQNGKHSKCTTSTPPENIRDELLEMARNPAKRLEDRRKIAVSLVAMALGLHDEPSVLFAQFNQQAKDQS